MSMVYISCIDIKFIRIWCFAGDHRFKKSLNTLIVRMMVDLALLSVIFCVTKLALGTHLMYLSSWWDADTAYACSFPCKTIVKVNPMRLCHPPYGSTSPKYKLLCFITAKINCKEKNALAFNRDRCCHLVLCLRLIPFHWQQLQKRSPLGYLAWKVIKEIH